jgi:Methane oxygenase PmoA
LWYKVRVKRLSIVVALLASAVLGSAADTPRIQVIPNDAARRVDVIIDGKPFTSYIYPTSQKKPVLFPLRTAKGTFVTRGWPLEPRQGERVDHPHHVGLWLNYGDVNGLDFWGHSEATPADQAAKMGTIVHRTRAAAKSGADRGDLTVEADWLAHDGHVVLRERTHFTFQGTAESRSVERITTLTATDRRVVFRDTKEGMFGLRVARGLEQPADKPEVFTDAAGRPEKVPALDNAGVTGQYVSSEGLKGDAVWGTRAKWVLLSGTVESEPVTVVMLDHPDNPGFPTYWHARGYGLFSANPLGQKDFTQGKQELNLAVEPGKSITFRYRVLILGASTPETIEREYRAFASSPSS